MAQKKKLRMQALREERGLTKAALARNAEMQQGVIGWIETGRYTPYESQLKKIAKALGYEGEIYNLIEEVK